MDYTIHAKERSGQKEPAELSDFSGGANLFQIFSLVS
jgi:hypothetical protein